MPDWLGWIALIGLGWGLGGLIAAWGLSTWLRYQRDLDDRE